MTFALTEHTVKTPRHTSFYLACGREDAPPVVFVHGWPELAISWRHQLPALAALGFRTIAPDMRGYGRSSVYGRHEDYALEHAVADLVELKITSAFPEVVDVVVHVEPAEAVTPAPGGP